jgi:tetratricopeptide (TPR) repeat protein
MGTGKYANLSFIYVTKHYYTDLVNQGHRKKRVASPLFSMKSNIITNETNSGGAKMKRLINIALIFSLALCFGTAAAASVADGDAAMKQKKYRDAVKEYEEYMKKNPNDDGAMIKLAAAYESANWYGQSVQWWEKYIKQFPDGKDIDRAKKSAAKDHRWLGANFYSNLGESPDLAVGHLKRAVELDPSLSDSYVWLARIDLSEGRFKDAVQVLADARNKFPGDKAVSWIYKVAKGKLDNGGAAYDKYEQGWRQYSQGDKAGALERFRAAAADNPDFSSAHLWIARILYENGDFAGSIPEWQTVIRLEPDNARAAWFLKQARAGATPIKK